MSPDQVPPSMTACVVFSLVFGIATVLGLLLIRPARRWSDARHVIPQYAVGKVVLPDVTPLIPERPAELSETLPTR